jgi:hypothetical protein
MWDIYGIYAWFWALEGIGGNVLIWCGPSILCGGPVAEWIMHRPPEPETMGSNPIGPAILGL